MEHVEVLRDLRDLSRAAIKAGDWKVDGACDPDAVLRRADAAIAALSAPQPPAEAQPVALDYVPVKRSDLLRWAEDFARDNDPGDDTDVVTPFDAYLLQPFADEFSHDLRALAQQPAAVYQCPRCATSMEVDPTAKPAAVDGLNVWRAAFLVERAARYREGGMKIEQARIHAETDAARIDVLAAQHQETKP